MVLQTVELPRPERLSKIGSLDTGPGILIHRPKYAADVAEVIAFFSQIDAIYEAMLIGLFAREGRAATLMLKAIKSHHERIRLIQRILEQRLRPEDKELAKKVEGLLDPMRQVRNVFAHGVWSSSPEYREDILVSDSADENIRSGYFNEFSRSQINDQAWAFLDEIASTNENGLTATEVETLSYLLDRRPPNGSRHIGGVFPSNFEIYRWDEGEMAKALFAAQAGMFTVLGLKWCIEESWAQSEAVRALITKHGLLPDYASRCIAPDNLS